MTAFEPGLALFLASDTRHLESEWRSFNVKERENWAKEEGVVIRAFMEEAKRSAGRLPELTQFEWAACWYAANNILSTYP